MDDYKNFAYSTLVAGISAAATSCSVASGTGSRFPSTAFDAVIWDTSYSSATAAVLAGAGEQVRVTARSTDALTITRAQGGTSAVAFNTTGRTYAIAQVLTEAAFEAMAPKDAAVLTGTTSIQALSPDIADLGTVASGTVTLSSTKAVNKVILSGSAATIALPATPPNGFRVLSATLTSTSAVTVTVPTLKRTDIAGSPEVTSVVFEAGVTGRRVRLLFEADALAYVGLYVVGDEPDIPSTALAGLEDDETIASPSASKFTSTRALVLYVAAQLDGLVFPYGDITGLTEGKFIVGDEDGTPILGTFGTGLNVNSATGVVTATAGGASSTVTVSGTEIDWADGLAQRDSISTNKAYTMANIADGQTLRLTITATGADRTPTWPSHVSFGDAGPPTITAGESVKIDFTCVVNAVLASYSPGHVIDVTPPETTAWQIQASGDVLHVTPSESITVTTPPAVTLTMTGGAVTATYDTGTSPMIYDLSRVVGSGETGTCSGTVTAGGVVDGGNNTLEDWTGETVDNDSSVGSSWWTEDFEGDTSTWTVSSGAFTLGSTSSPINGTKSAYSATSNSLAYRALPSAADAAVLDGLVRFGGAMPTSTTTLAGFRTAANVITAAMRVNGSGSPLLYTNGNDSSTSAFTMLVNTTYKFRIEFLRNSTCTLYVAAVGDPYETSDSIDGAVITKTAADVASERVSISRGNTGNDVRYDDLVASPS